MVDYDSHFLAEIDILVSKLLGFETFANFFRVSVSENLVSEKKFQFQFRKIRSQKKVSVSENLVSKKVSVSVENLVSEKKSRYRSRSKFWYRNSVLPRQLWSGGLVISIMDVE